QARRNQAASRQVRLPQRQGDYRAGGRAAGEPGLCDRTSVVRDVEQLHEPGSRAARTVGQEREVRSRRAHAAEEARRRGGSPASRQAGGQTDEAVAKAGRLSRRRGRRTVQARALSVLTRPLPVSPAGEEDCQAKNWGCWKIRPLPPRVAGESDSTAI